MEEQTILAKIMSIIAPDMEDEDESAESEEDDLKCKEFLDMSFAPVSTVVQERSQFVFGHNRPFSV